MVRRCKSDLAEARVGNWIQRLKLKHLVPLSSFALNFYLRHYTEGGTPEPAAPEAASPEAATTGASFSKSPNAARSAAVASTAETAARVATVAYAPEASAAAALVGVSGIIQQGDVGRPPSAVVLGRLHGLTTDEGAAVNGLTVLIEAFDVHRTRYVVTLPGGRLWRLRPGNLHILRPNNEEHVGEAHGGAVDVQQGGEHGAGPGESRGSCTTVSPTTILAAAAAPVTTANPDTGDTDATAARVATDVHSAAVASTSATAGRVATVTCAPGASTAGALVGVSRFFTRGGVDRPPSAVVYGLTTDDEAAMNGLIVQLVAFDIHGTRFVVTLPCGRRVLLRARNLDILRPNNEEHVGEAVQTGEVHGTMRPIHAGEADQPIKVASDEDCSPRHHHFTTR